jgi:hypothetical protein
MFDCHTYSGFVLGQGVLKLKSVEVAACNCVSSQNPEPPMVFGYRFAVHTMIVGPLHASRLQLVANDTGGISKTRTAEALG